MPTSDPVAVLAALVARLALTPRPERAAVIGQILPLLAEPRVPLTLRITAAARVLRFVPDRRRPVRRITRKLTAGVSSIRGLERLRQLQNRIEICHALDELIEAGERRVKMACPRCKMRLPRVEMVKHLWDEHQLILDGGKTRTVGRRVSELREAHSTTGDAEPLDRAAELGGAAGLRAWLAAAPPSDEELAPLLAMAAEHGCGLCPACFAEISAAPPLPLPLDLGRDRLSGEGFAIQLGGNAWVRTISISTPDASGAWKRISLSGRTMATLLAVVVLLAPLFISQSLAHTFTAIAVALVAYLIARLWRRTPHPTAALIDAAWTRIVPDLIERESAARFLTRLCLASLGRGDPTLRAKSLSAIAARASARADRADVELQLLAAASVLQVDDGALFGRDTVERIATLANGFPGERSAEFAECVMAAFLSRDREPSEITRLGTLLTSPWGAGFFRRRCPACGGVSFVSSGAVGRALPEG